MGTWASVLILLSQLMEFKLLMYVALPSKNINGLWGNI